MERLRIGIDLDNTLINYDHVFVSQARARGLVDDEFVGSKKQLRDVVRDLPDGQTKWMALQGRVYGAHIEDATLFDGAGSFLRRCYDGHCDVYIVSHKTAFGHLDAQRINLREAALGWMHTHDFFNRSGFSINQQNVFFCSTRQEKCQRIARLGLAHFIDDLQEVFLEASFPTGVQQHLFQPHGAGQSRSWAEIENDIFEGS